MRLKLIGLVLLSGACLFGCGNDAEEPIEEKPYSHIESTFDEFETIINENYDQIRINDFVYSVSEEPESMYKECDNAVFINVFYTVTDVLDYNYKMDDLKELNEAMLNETMEGIVNNYNTDGTQIVVTLYGMHGNSIMIEQVMNNVEYKRAIEEGIDTKEQINTIKEISEDKFEYYLK